MQSKMFALAFAFALLVKMSEASQDCDLEDKSAMLQSKMLADDLIATSTGITSPKLFGALEGLLGTWEGAHGRNVVAVPKYYDSGTQGVASFTLLAQDYTETLSFWPIWGKVLNRGTVDAAQYRPTGQLDQVLLGGSSERNRYAVPYWDYHTPLVIPLYSKGV